MICADDSQAELPYMIFGTLQMRLPQTNGTAHARYVKLLHCSEECSLVSKM